MDLALWLQEQGWMMSLLTLEGRLVWLQADKAGKRIEVEIRGMTDVVNACGVLRDMVIRQGNVKRKEAA
jgi:hypothetical protein